MEYLVNGDIDFLKRGSQSFTSVRVINISTKDNHSAAKVAGDQTAALVSKVSWKTMKLEWMLILSEFVFVD